MPLRSALCVLFGSAAMFLHAGNISDEDWQKTVAFYRNTRTPEEIDRFRDFAAYRRSVRTPPPVEDLGHQRLAAFGYVDVTAAPFEATPDDQTDDTAAIQAAIVFARDNRMAVFFPPGDYRISNTIRAAQGLVFNSDTGALSSTEDLGCILVGSTADPDRRARLVLVDGAAGFDDPAKPKLVVRYWKPFPPDRGAEPLVGEFHQQNYSQFLGSIDIVTGNNPGAIALHFQGAEGSTVQDVRIDARRGLGGVQGLSGSGGSYSAVTVLGGRFGIDTREIRYDRATDTYTVVNGTGTQPGPTVSNVTLLDQAEWAIRLRSRGSLVAVGVRIRSSKAGPVIRVESQGTFAPFESSLALIDARIEYTDPGEANTVFSSDRSFYLQNTFLRNARHVFRPEIDAEDEGWTWIRQLAVHVKPAAPRDGYDPHETVWRNGEPYGDLIYDAENGVAPPEDLQSRHDWNNRFAFPTFESPGAVNVVDYGATPNDSDDDTDAIQQAIDGSEIVFFPRGEYLISRTLKLGSKTKLIGVFPKLSSIIGVESQAAGRFGGPNEDPKVNGRPMIETADDAGAETVIAFLGIRPGLPWAQHDPTPIGVYGVKWQAGTRSIVRTIELDYASQGNFFEREAYRRHGVANIDQQYPTNSLGTDEQCLFPQKLYPEYDVQPAKHPLAKIVNKGGGRWYNFWKHGYEPFDDVTGRALLIEGTSNRTRIYHLHAQHSRAHAQIEIRDARNVDIYGTKTEHYTRFIDVVRSSHIRIHGHAGAFQPFASGGTHYRFLDSDSILLSNFGEQIGFNMSVTRNDCRSPLRNAAPSNYFPLIDQTGESRVSVPGEHRPVLYQRGNAIDFDSENPPL